MRMQRFLPAVFLLASCDPVGFKVVSISPIYGWEDGCTDIKVSGHGFDADIQVTLGGTAIDNLTLPDQATNPLDVGFVVYGTTPPSAVGADYATLTVTSGGETSELTEAFFYTACPAAVYVEGVSATDAVAAGDEIGLSGCGLDASAVTVKVGSSDAVNLTSVCSTAQATFTAPAADPGCHYVGFFDSAGNQLAPDPGCDITLACDVPQGKGDTGDSGYIDFCAGAPTLTYGGAK